MSENHIRGISTTLSVLDKSLCDFEQWAPGHEVRSVLYGVENTLSPAQREVIATEVAAMKAILQEIKTTLHLEGSVRLVERMMRSSCALLWASLTELEGSRLRRYGEVPQDLADYLDPKVVALNARLRRISDVVERGDSR